MADDLPWFTLSEAAARSGLHQEALRARAKRGQIPARRGNRGQWLVQLQPELAQGNTQGQGEQLAEVVRDLEEALAETRERLARAEARVEAKDVLVEELRAMLAETRKPWWRRWIER
jgi:DNA-binding transcriptional MerR regulator